jgi:hypothetical protein
LETNQQGVKKNIFQTLLQGLFKTMKSLKKTSNITFLCNKFKGTMKLSIIMDNYSTVVNGLPKEFNTKRV